MRRPWRPSRSSAQEPGDALVAALAGPGARRLKAVAEGFDVGPDLVDALAQRARHQAYFGGPVFEFRTHEVEAPLYSAAAR